MTPPREFLETVVRPNVDEFHAHSYRAPTTPSVLCEDGGDLS
jgi:hypothetical protein